MSHMFRNHLVKEFTAYLEEGFDYISEKIERIR